MCDGCNEGATLAYVNAENLHHGDNVAFAHGLFVRGISDESSPEATRLADLLSTTIGKMANEKLVCETANAAGPLCRPGELCARIKIYRAAGSVDIGQSPTPKTDKDGGTGLPEHN